jgi:hypothetical protein
MSCNIVALIAMLVAMFICILLFRYLKGESHKIFVLGFFISQSPPPTASFSYL